MVRKFLVVALVTHRIVGADMGLFSGLKKVVKKVASAVDSVINTVGEILGRIVGLPGFVLDLFVPWPRKKLRMRILILQDESGGPLSTTRDIVAEARSAYDLARTVLRREANVKLITYGSHPRVEILDALPPKGALEPRCRGPFVDFFGAAGTFYLTHKQYSVSILFLGNGAPVTTFVVREIEGGDKVGCSPGAFADYCTVSIDGLTFPSSDDVGQTRTVSTTLVHELGHSCGLNYMLGSEHSDDESNLMYSTQKIRGTEMSRLQVAVLRNSRFVTYL
ncbi:MAG: hypothetical protein WD672_03810 [Woeseia sp.]